MKKSDNSIYELIHSMTKEEKRTFSLLQNMYQKKTKKHHIIFDLIVKYCIRCDDELIKTAKEKGISIKYLPPLKKYLKEMLLRSIIYNQSGKINFQKNYQYELIKIQVYFNKGLYSECIKEFNQLLLKNEIQLQDYTQLNAFINTYQQIFFIYNNLYYFPFLRKEYNRFLQLFDPAQKNLEFRIRLLKTANQLLSSVFKIHFGNETEWDYSKEIKEILSHRNKSNCFEFIYFLYASCRYYLHIGKHKKFQSTLRILQRTVVKTSNDDFIFWMKVQYLFLKGLDLIMKKQTVQLKKMIYELQNIENKCRNTYIAKEAEQKINLLAVKHLNVHQMWILHKNIDSVVDYFSNKKDHFNKHCIYCMFELVKYYLIKKDIVKCIHWCQNILKEYHNEKDLNVTICVRWIMYWLFFIKNKEIAKKEEKFLYKKLTELKCRKTLKFIQTLNNWLKSGKDDSEFYNILNQYKNERLLIERYFSIEWLKQLKENTELSS